MFGNIAGRVVTILVLLCGPVFAGFAHEPREGAPRVAADAALDDAGAPTADAHLEPREGVVLAHFPSEPSALREDVAEVADEILKRHGAEEWKAALLTNELHRHLGIYSLVGVKMGIRARELLDASLDDLRVESHAGLRPPTSCLTDGLQVATGATLGRGTIRVEQTESAPEAVFTKRRARLQLALKEEVRNQIRSDVAAAVEQFGRLTPEYFEEIRRLSIRYWLTLDRREIFEEVRGSSR